MSITAEPTYVSVPKLARRLGVAKDTLYKACRAGQVPGAFRISSRWLVNLDAFEEAQREAAKAVALRLSVPDVPVPDALAADALAAESPSLAS